MHVFNYLLARMGYRPLPAPHYSLATRQLGSCPKMHRQDPTHTHMHTDTIFSSLPRLLFSPETSLLSRDFPPLLLLLSPRSHETSLLSFSFSPPALMRLLSSPSPSVPPLLSFFPLPALIRLLEFQFKGARQVLKRRRHHLPLLLSLARNLRSLGERCSQGLQWSQTELKS